MSWLDQLKQASFRGVPFEVDTVEIQAGDRVVLREYPFADLPAVFRMGAAAETIRFSAYVIGSDYMERREALRQVLTGEGVLVHPTAGSMRAFVADTYRMTEAPLREGTVVRFDLTFVRAEVRTYPAPKPNTQLQAASAAAAAKGAAVGQFGAEFSIATAPAWVQERVVDRIGQLVDGAWSQIKGVTSGMGSYTDGIVGSFQVLRSGLSDLVETPAAFAGSLRTLFELPSDLDASTAAALRSAYQAVFGLGSRVQKSDFEVASNATADRPAMFGAGQQSALSLDTAARAQLEVLNGAADRLVDSLAIAAWVEAVAAADLDGHEQVLAQRRWLYEQCTALLQDASGGAAPLAEPGTSWHDAMLGMLTAALGDMMARGADRARLSAYVPQACMSIWQLSYLLYGTADWADEIMTMNPHIRHPLLVPAGLPVRVVQHG